MLPEFPWKLACFVCRSLLIGSIVVKVFEIFHQLDGIGLVCATFVISDRRISIFGLWTICLIFDLRPPFFVCNLFRFAGVFVVRCYFFIAWWWSSSIYFCSFSFWRTFYVFSIFSSSSPLTCFVCYCKLCAPWTVRCWLIYTSTFFAFFFLSVFYLNSSLSLCNLSKCFLCNFITFGWLFNSQVV